MARTKKLSVSPTRRLQDLKSQQIFETDSGKINPFAPSAVADCHTPSASSSPYHPDLRTKHWSDLGYLAVALIILLVLRRLGLDLSIAYSAFIFLVGYRCFGSDSCEKLLAKLASRR